MFAHETIYSDFIRILKKTFFEVGNTVQCNSFEKFVSLEYKNTDAIFLEEQFLSAQTPLAQELNAAKIKNIIDSH